MKGFATLTQSQKDALFRATHPDSELFQDRGTRYRNAARELAYSSDSWLEMSLYELFGPEFIGNLAFMLDPASPFKVTFGLISEWSRYREKQTGQLDWIRSINADSVQYANYIVDLPDNVPEYLVSSSSDPPDNTQISAFYLGPTFTWDTTVASRGKDSPFGEFWLQKPDHSLEKNPVLDRTIRTKTPVFDDPTKYDRYIDHWRFDPGGALSEPLGPIFVDALPWAMDAMNGVAWSMVRLAAATKPLFNTFYQIAELKDVPQTIRGIKSLKDKVQVLASSHGKTVTKDVIPFLTDQYLNLQFGIVSYVQAIEALLLLPSRAAKKLNYLLGRSNKVTTSRFKQDFLFETPMGSPPSFSFNLPDWASIDSSTVTHRIKGQFKMVLNQTIKMPSVAVPKLSDTNYRDLLGLNPSWIDLYNLIPWTWLVNWFSDLGDYLNILETIHSDSELINYGLLSLVGTEEVVLEFKVKVSESALDYDGPDPYANLIDKFYDYRYVYTREHHFRVNVANFDGVKTWGTLPGTNLTDYQASILGALLGKFA